MPQRLWLTLTPGPGTVREPSDSKGSSPEQGRTLPGRGERRAPATAQFLLVASLLGSGLGGVTLSGL